jgi:RNA polymerase primary sigma factor
MKILAECDLATPDEISADAKLCEKVGSGDAIADQEFYERYHRLARYFGNLAARNCRTGVVDEDDLSQEALLYMLETSKKYSEEKDTPFHSYASAFIRHHLERSAALQYGAKLPVHIQLMLGKINRINNDRLNNRRSPMTDKDIAREFNIPNWGPDRNRVTVGCIRQAMLLTNYIGSIDTGYSPHTDSSPGNEYILDEIQHLQSLTIETEPTAEEVAEANHLKEQVGKILEILDDREAEILRMRHGIGSDNPMTLEQVAEVIGVTRERIRQLEARVINHIRESKKFKNIRTTIGIENE